MTFAQPYFLLLLLLLPLLAWLKGRHGREAAFLYSSIQLVKGITSLTRSRAGSFLPKLRWLALAFFIVALARPQLGEGEAKITASGIDIVVALDLSGSMKAPDFELWGQRVDRITIAKDVLEKFIRKRLSDRIGLVAFASRAYIASPLTLDPAGNSGADCSQMATFYPALSSFAMYGSAEWYGTPHNGTPSLDREVSWMSRMREPTSASSKNIS